MIMLNMLYVRKRFKTCWSQTCSVTRLTMLGIKHAVIVAKKVLQMFTSNLHEKKN
jgi:hypothetical protein